MQCDPQPVESGEVQALGLQERGHACWNTQQSGVLVILSQNSRTVSFKKILLSAYMDIENGKKRHWDTTCDLGLPITHSDSVSEIIVPLSSGPDINQFE